jgi:hypothetical protein
VAAAGGAAFTVTIAVDEADPPEPDALAV